MVTSVSALSMTTCSVDGLVGDAGPDLRDAGRLYDDVTGLRASKLSGVGGHGGTAGLAVEALHGVLARLPEGLDGALHVEVRGGHNLHAGDAGDLRDQAATHLAHAHETDPDRSTLALESFQLVLRLTGLYLPVRSRSGSYLQPRAGLDHLAQLLDSRSFQVDLPR